MAARFALSPSRIARFFYHECERNLRYLATPSAQRKEDRVPAPPHDESPVTEAVLEGGYAWEEEVVSTHLKGRVHVAAGAGPLRDRNHDTAATVNLLRSLAPGHTIYQATIVPPASFLARYGLDPDLIDFRACRPDLIELVDDGVGRLRIVDVKASEHLKASHRVQVALYALMLREMLEAEGITTPVDLDEGGVWLYGHNAPEAFSLTMTMGPLETFLRERLAPILEAPIADVPWHLFFRCEWCEYFDHCRKEAEDTRSVSLVPYLSIGARKYLREAPWQGTAVNTLMDLRTLLASQNGHAALDACGSLRGRGERLHRVAEALEDGKARPHGGSTVAMPVRENVRLVLTLQREPFSGFTYAAGFRRSMGKDVYGNGASEQIFVADSQDACADVRRSFIEALHAELVTLHDYNDGRPWAEQKALQTYVFDSYERELLDEMLLAALDEPELAPKALNLFFYFQDSTLAAADQHPGVEIPYPIVVLTRVLREVMALPSPVALRLSDVYQALPNPDYAYEYKPLRLLNFDLANPLRADAIFGVWRHDKREGLDWVHGELRQRLNATGCVVDGLRQKIGDKLFAWPRKFSLPEAQSFRHPELSRVAFVVRYESFTSALAARDARAQPWSERIRDWVSIPVRYQGGDTWIPEVELPASAIEEDGDFPNHILVPEGEEGERAQMAYDDHRYRSARYAPRGLVRLAAVSGVSADPNTGLATSLEIKLTTHAEQPAFKPKARAVLHPRFTDFTSGRVLQRLAALDQEDGSDFVTLLRAPAAFATQVQEPARARRSLARTGAGLTPSQEKAFAQFCTNRLTLVWGPPGTGKTYFVAKALRLLAAARDAAGLGLRVGITAFTHAAVENLLREIVELGMAEGDALPVFKVGRVATPRGEKLPVLDPAEVVTNQDRIAIFGSTVYGFRKAADAGLAPFDVLVVDEASQTKLGEFALATMVLAPEGRLMLAGDDLQLPPIIKGSYPEPEDGLPGLEGSIFEYLRARDDTGKPYTRPLLECWRMNETLCRFPASTLYGDGYLPATAEVAARALELAPPKSREPDDELAEWLLDPAWPLAVCILDGVRASVENLVEAKLVARLSGALRRRLIEPGTERAYPATAAGDRRFWSEGLFIVSPHHAQIRAITSALAEVHPWKAEAFVDTVDKMQGQQCQAVIVSYGVSDGETALGEAEFIYSRNRLNVSVTRAKAKCIVFLPRPLLEPSFDLLSNEAAAVGLGHMHALVAFCRKHGEERRFASASLEGASGSLAAIRCRFPS